MRILIVEDDSATLKMYKSLGGFFEQLLEAFGSRTQIIEAKDGVDAIVEISKYNFRIPIDIAVIDLGLPEGEFYGVDVAKAFRKKFAANPVIFLTALDQTGKIKKVLTDFGERTVTYFLKTSSKEDLIKRMKELLNL